MLDTLSFHPHLCAADRRAAKWCAYFDEAGEQERERAELARKIAQEAKKKANKEAARLQERAALAVVPEGGHVGAGGELYDGEGNLITDSQGDIVFARDAQLPFKQDQPAGGSLPRPPAMSMPASVSKSRRAPQSFLERPDAPETRQGSTGRRAAVRVSLPRPSAVGAASKEAASTTRAKTEAGSSSLTAGTATGVPAGKAAAAAAARAATEAKAKATVVKAKSDAIRGSVADHTAAAKQASSPSETSGRKHGPPTPPVPVAEDGAATTHESVPRTDSSLPLAPAPLKPQPLRPAPADKAEPSVATGTVGFGAFRQGMTGGVGGLFSPLRSPAGRLMDWERRFDDGIMTWKRLSRRINPKGIDGDVPQTPQVIHAPRPTTAEGQSSMGYAAGESLQESSAHFVRSTAEAGKMAQAGVRLDPGDPTAQATGSLIPCDPASLSRPYSARMASERDTSQLNASSARAFAAATIKAEAHGLLLSANLSPRPLIAPPPLEQGPHGVGFIDASGVLRYRRRREYFADEQLSELDGRHSFTQASGPPVGKYIMPRPSSRKHRSRGHGGRQTSSPAHPGALGPPRSPLRSESPRARLAPLGATSAEFPMAVPREAELA